MELLHHAVILSDQVDGSWEKASAIPTTNMNDEHESCDISLSLDTE